MLRTTNLVADFRHPLDRDQLAILNRSASAACDR